MKTKQQVLLLAMILFVIGAIPAVADVSSSSNPALVGQPVVLTVTIDVPVGVTATPTGTVTFTANGTEIGAAMVENGAARLATQFFSPGDQTIVAQYSGDENFQPVTSTPFLEHVTADDIFTVSVSPSVLAQSAGQNSSVNVTLFTQGSAGLAHLSCEDLPPGVHCTFQPDAVTPSTNGASSAATITSTGARTGLVSAGIPVLALAGLVLPFCGRRKHLRSVLGPLLLFAFLFGCGSHTYTVPVTPSGSYSIRIVASDGANTQTATVKLPSTED